MTARCPTWEDPLLDTIVRACELLILTAIAVGIARELTRGIRDLHDRHRAGLARVHRMRDRDLERDPHAAWIAALGREVTR